MYVTREIIILQMRRGGGGVSTGQRWLDQQEFQGFEEDLFEFNLSFVPRDKSCRTINGHTVTDDAILVKESPQVELT